MSPPQRIHDCVKLVNKIVPTIRGEKAARMKTSRNCALRNCNLQFFGVLRCVLAMSRQPKACIKANNMNTTCRKCFTYSYSW